MAYTKQQLEALKNSLLASGQPITAATHRALVQKLIDELYDAQSRGNLLAGVQNDITNVSGDVTLVIRSGQAYLIPTSNLVAAGLSFDDLNGVVIVDPQNGDLLAYDALTDTWRNVENTLTGDFVPYGGASASVDLGEFGMKAGFLQLDTTPTGTPEEAGVIFWDADDLTVDIRLNGYVMKIGEDLFYPVTNQTGSSIPKGTPVRFAGTLGASGRLLIALFLADGSLESQVFMGVTAETIANGAAGKVLWFGRIRKINTSAFSEGDILYASPTVAGGFTSTKPAAPNNIISVAAVINSSASQGVIFVRPQIEVAAAIFSPIVQENFTLVDSAGTVTFTYDYRSFIYYRQGNTIFWSLNVSGVATGAPSAGGICKITGIVAPSFTPIPTSFGLSSVSSSRLNYIFGSTLTPAQIANLRVNLPFGGNINFNYRKDNLAGYTTFLGNGNPFQISLEGHYYVE